MLTFNLTDGDLTLDDKGELIMDQNGNQIPIADYIKLKEQICSEK